jgi:probable F420-dependent oxidoreductase
MQVGLFVVPLTAPVESLRAIGERADRESGIHSLWIPEPHLLVFDEYESEFTYAEDGKMPDAYTADGELDGLLALGFLSAITSRLRLGIGVCIVPQRQPVYVAKDVTTLDHLSDGRFDFGVGIGWMKEEFRAVGASFGDRAARCADDLRLMSELWSDGPVASGPFAGARQEPYPVQRPRPPIHFGGNSRRALERVAQFGHGWLPWDLTPEQAHSGISMMEEVLAAHDRDRAEIEVSVATTQAIDAIDTAAWAATGIDQLLIVIPTPRSPDEVDRVFDQLGQTLAAAAEA